MKLDTSSSTRSIYNVLRNKANGIVYSASDCPLGRMDAPHFLDHHTCACEVSISAPEGVSATPPALRPTAPGAEIRAPRVRLPRRGTSVAVVPEPAEPSQLSMQLMEVGSE